MKRLVGELQRVEEVEGGETIVDEYGMEWKEHTRYIKLIGYREGNQLIRELPAHLKDKVIPQHRKLCIAPGYEWHFTTKIGVKPVLITFDEPETQKIEQEAKN